MPMAHITTREHGPLGVQAALAPHGYPGAVQNWSFPSKAVVLWRADPTVHSWQHSGEERAGPVLGPGSTMELTGG